MPSATLDSSQQPAQIDYQNMTKEQAKQAEEQILQQRQECERKIADLKKAKQIIDDVSVQIGQLIEESEKAFFGMGNKQRDIEISNLKQKRDDLISNYSENGKYSGITEKITEYENRLVQLDSELDKIPPQSSHI